MNVALVGPGAMGGEHAAALRRLGGVRNYVVAGPHEGAVVRFAMEHGFERWTLDPLEAIADPLVDAVVIASPNHAHAHQAMAAIAHGKHVLIEIPVAMSAAEAEELALAARGSGVVAMAGYISRYYPAIRALKERAVVGGLTIRHLVCAMGTDKRLNRNWKGEQRDWVDDLLWHHGMHVLDVVLHLLDWDPLVDAKAVAGSAHPDHGGLMDAGVTLRFESGALATIALTYHAQQQFTRYTVVADEGFVELRQDAPGRGAADLTCGQPFSALVDAQDADFVAACRTGGASPIPIEAVLPAARLTQRLVSSLLAPAGDHGRRPSARSEGELP